MMENDNTSSLEEEGMEKLKRVQNNMERVKGLRQVWANPPIKATSKSPPTPTPNQRQKFGKKKVSLNPGGDQTERKRKSPLGQGGFGQEVKRVTRSASITPAPSTKQDKGSGSGGMNKGGGGGRRRSSSLRRIYLSSPR